jgi:putative nucleotidyltransferase with HDIG domain
MDVTREEAWKLLTEFTQNPNLIKHALAVEAAMRAYARYFGEDEEVWGVVGLLHDFDYERYPTQADHVWRGMEILRERGWPEEIVRAVAGHASYTGIPRETRMARALFAVDELTGLIVAVALVRPSKSILDVTVESVQKKWHDKAFARGANRKEIEQGAAELGIPLEEHIAIVLQAMQGIADDLGLRGTSSPERS